MVRPHPGELVDAARARNAPNSMNVWRMIKAFSRLLCMNDNNYHTHTHTRTHARTVELSAWPAEQRDLRAVFMFAARSRFPMHAKVQCTRVVPGIPAQF